MCRFCARFVCGRSGGRRVGGGGSFWGRLVVVRLFRWAMGGCDGLWVGTVVARVLVVGFRIPSVWSTFWREGSGR